MDTCDTKKGDISFLRIEEYCASRAERQSPSPQSGLARLSQSELTRGGGCAVNFDKIVKNPVNIDKFTGLFNKKLAGKTSVKNCNKTIISINMSAVDSNNYRIKF